MTEEQWYERAYQPEGIQLTARALLMGTVLGFFLSFTNIYIGLKTGWFLGVAITACLVSYAMWGVFLRAGLAKTPMTILENTCMASTASSAGYATGNTLVTAIPAMLLLTVTEQNPLGTQLPWYLLGIWVFFLAALGVVMAIPMKRNMINHERLKFPSGTAAAVTLQSLYSQGTEAAIKGKALLWSSLVGLAVPLLKDLEFLKTTDAAGKVERHAILPDHSNIFDVGITMSARQYDPKTHEFIARVFKPSDWLIRLDHSLVLVAAGAIVGLRTTISMVLGATVLALFLGPLGMGWDWAAPTGKILTAVTRPGSAWKEVGIWLGAPLMVSYGLMMFAMQWRTIVRALSGMGDTASAGRHQDVEVPTRWFVSGMAIAGLGIVIVAWYFFKIPPHLGILAVLMTFFLALVACRATGETDITPGSALGKIMQLTYGVLMPQSTTANLMTAAITSGSALASADLLNDLKSGYLLGANPRRQFVAQFLGIFTGTVASTLGYFILIPNATALTGVGDRPPAFAAPGAQQWRAVAELFKVGLDNLHPMSRYMIIVGVSVGLLLALLERFVPASKRFLPSATGLGLGLILPFFTSFSMFLGAFLGWLFERLNPKLSERLLIPISSGLIAGESIIGVIVAGLNNFVLT
jgi:uncharacterized oligopeptide transporter (OPT) family protein